MVLIGWASVPPGPFNGWPRENIKVEVEDRMHFLHRKCPLYHPAFYPERIYMTA
jgi:hypothetical protein